MIAENNYRVSFGVITETAQSTNFQIEECSENRSLEYIRWIKTLDKYHNIETQPAENKIAILHQEFEGTETKIIPKFVVARCQLGHPHDIHLIDTNNGYAVSHFKKEDVLPTLLQKARILAKNYNYAFVEVYEDKILLIRT